MRDERTTRDGFRPAHARAAWCLAWLLVGFILLQAEVGRCASDARLLGQSAAAQLMQKKLYAEAARLLETDIRGVDEAEIGPQLLMLGECYYLQGQYGEARPWFLKAFQNLPYGKNKIVVQYRLAALAYRLSDTAEALKLTDAFVREFPNDIRSGRLLILKMQFRAQRGAGAEPDVDAVRNQIAMGGGKYGAAISVAADKVLTDYYLANGYEEKAVNGYLGIVNNFRQAQVQFAREKRAVPVDLEEAHDYAAMQLGMISIRAKREAEATKWLESVRFNTESVWKARLMLAQIAYQGNDYRRAEGYLLDNGFIDGVAPGDVRSDMYLLLGFCAKRAQQPSLEQVFNYFEKVEKGTKGYAQAQMGMADTASKWRQPEASARYFENACVSGKYEAEALFNLGTIYLALAEQEKDPVKRDALFAKAADRYNALTTQYAASAFAKDAGEPIKTLLAKGLHVTLTVSDEDIVKQWESVVAERPGAAEAARALINIARMHQNAVLHEKTKQFIKAPNYAACVDACNRLLNPTVFTGTDLQPEQWQFMRGEALYFRGLCVVSSLGQTPSATDNPAQPVYIANPDVTQALADLTQALAWANPRETKLVKDIEMVRLEALFKSGIEANRQQAETRFNELTEAYGREPRLQRLAMELAQWHHEQGNLIVAAEMYQGIASRAGAELAHDDVVKVLSLGGKLFSRAAQDITGNADARRYGIYIHPKEVIEFASLLETHKPFRNMIRLENVEAEISGEQAIKRVSEASKIPFVWAKTGRGTIGEYLRNKRLTFTKNSGTVREFLEEILDFKVQDLAFDVGLTREAPTMTPPPREEQSPDEVEVGKVIEIYTRGDWAGRFEPLSRNYGVWSRLHTGQSMLFSVARRVEEITGVRILWAEGVDSEDVLAMEYNAPPGKDPNVDITVGELLQAILEPCGLSFKIVPREVTTELYEKAKECFNDIRKIAPKSPEGEESLFLLALNYYRQEDYNRMKIVLQEYLKVFDGPGYPNYHRACFWVGWVFEKDRRFRDAAKYYQRAAEEYVTVYTVDTHAPVVSKDVATARLSYDSRFAFDEHVSGIITNMPFADRFLHYVRINTSVDVRLDPSAASIRAPVDVGSFRNRKVYDIFWDVLTAFGLGFRVENNDPETADKAYYRLAFCYKQEGMNEQALAACETELDRYPATTRKKDALKLRLDIYKALKDYGNVLKALMTLKAAASNPDEERRVDYERAWIYIDLCRYAEAQALFKDILAASQGAGERLVVRDGYARSLLRGGNAEAALTQYETLVKEETSELRLFVEEMLVWYLQRALGKASDDQLPPRASALMQRYEALDETGRAALDRNTVTQVTWVYYATALVDLLRKDVDRALAKFDAASNSPDDWLAADAILHAAEIHAAAGRLEPAREALDYLLFSTKSAEGEVRALFLLAKLLRQIGDERKAEERLDVLVKRFPDSAPGLLVIRERTERAAAEEQARREAEEQARREAEEKAAAEANAGIGGTDGQR